MVVATITFPKKRAIVIQFKTLCSKRPDEVRKVINTRLKKIDDDDVKLEYITKLYGFITGCPSVKTTSKPSDHFNPDELRDLITYISKVKLIVEKSMIDNINLT
jgi:hypothetical protein